MKVIAEIVEALLAWHRMSFWLSRWTNWVAFSGVDFKMSVGGDEVGTLARSSVGVIDYVHCGRNAWYQLRHFGLRRDFVRCDGFVNLCNKPSDVVPKQLLCVGVCGPFLWSALPHWVVVSSPRCWKAYWLGSLCSSQLTSGVSLENELHNSWTSPVALSSPDFINLLRMSKT